MYHTWTFLWNHIKISLIYTSFKVISNVEDYQYNVSQRLTTVFFLFFVLFCFLFVNSYQTYGYRKSRSVKHLNEKRHICIWSYIDLEVSKISSLQILVYTYLWFFKRFIYFRNLEGFIQRVVLLNEIDAISTVICSHGFSGTLCRFVQFIHIY